MKYRYATMGEITQETNMPNYTIKYRQISLPNPNVFVKSLTYTKDKIWILESASKITIISTEDKSVLSSFVVDEDSDSPECSLIINDSTHVFVASTSGKISVFDVHTHQLMRTKKLHPFNINTFLFEPNTDIFISCDVTGNIFTWCYKTSHGFEFSHKLKVEGIVTCAHTFLHSESKRVKAIFAVANNQNCSIYCIQKVTSDCMESKIELIIDLNFMVSSICYLSGKLWMCNEKDL